MAWLQVPSAACYHLRHLRLNREIKPRLETCPPPADGDAHCCGKGSCVFPALCCWAMAACWALVLLPCTWSDGLVNMVSVCTSHTVVTLHLTFVTLSSHCTYTVVTPLLRHCSCNCCCCYLEATSAEIAASGVNGFFCLAFEGQGSACFTIAAAASASLSRWWLSTQLQ